MSMSTTQLPVFVYGTLRSGEGNYRRILEGKTARERAAVLPDHTIVGLGVPFALPRPGRQVVGEVMDIRPADVWHAVLRSLDRLEGYTGRDDRDVYTRVVRDVLCEGELVSCYVYLAAAASIPHLERRPEIPNGDWVAQQSDPTDPFAY